MSEYLIVGGKNDDTVLSALAVAADLHSQKEAQVDIAVPPARVELAQLGKTPRRIVAANVTPSGIPQLAEKAKTPGGGWRGMLTAAQSVAQSAAQSAKQNFSQYRELAEELRLTRYDVVIDLDADAAGLVVARIANAEKILGFAAANIPNAATGASLLYHETRAPSTKLPYRTQCRLLAGLYFGYEPSSIPEWNFKETPPPPPWVPNSRFILQAGNVPPPFAEILSGSDIDTVLLPANATAAEILAAVTAAAVIVGNGIAATLATTTTNRVLFIGGAQHLPPGAILIESPAALKDEFTTIAPPAVAAPTPTPTTTPPDMETTTAAPTTPPADTEVTPTAATTPAPSGGGLQIKK